MKKVEKFLRKGVCPDCGGTRLLAKDIRQVKLIDATPIGVNVRSMVATYADVHDGEMGKGQSDSVFVFDEPTIGLHPLDVETLLQVFRRLIDNGATVIVIERDLDAIRNADYVIDMGSGGGIHGGRIIAAGTPQEICNDKNSLTGKYLKRYMANDH